MNKTSHSDIASRVASSVLAELSYDDVPRIETQEFEGSAVRRRDRIKMVIEDGSGQMGPASYYGIRLSNPNRGTTFFAVDDEADLDKLEASFKSAMQGIRQALKKHRDAVKDFFKKVEEEQSAKKGGA